MKLKVRRWQAVIEERLEEAGQPAATPLRKAAIVAYVANPYAGRYVGDLTPLIEASPALGAEMSERLMAAYGARPVLGYGKAGVVGIAGEQEHANALLTTAAAEPLRAAVGGGKAWISSVTKLGGPGTVLDVPLAHKDALYVRSVYNAITLYLPDGPLPDEIALVFAVCSGERINARVGGLRLADVQGRDGLV
jgi:hypothetical protein